jgi:spore germination protein YaaH
MMGIRKLGFLVWLAPILLLLAYLLYSQTDLFDRYFQKRVQTQVISEPRKVSLWMAEWDRNAGEKDWEKWSAAPDSVQAFGVYFDKNDQLFISERLKELITTLKAEGNEEQDRSFKLYLSFINDIVAEGAASIQKDPELVNRLTSSEEARSIHIEQIVNTALAYGVDGVEIDYERIATNAWPGVQLFYASLYEALRLEGLSLRIVLETRTPLESLKLPIGPEYSIMAYNLYGYHSGPGPKADFAFIGKIAARLDSVPGGASIAFSAGGFDWNEENGIIKALTELQAKELETTSNKSEQRDKNSGALSFTYLDEQKNSHTVWYADHETMNLWIKAAEQRGIYRFDLWRPGGLSDETINVWSSLSVNK